MKKGNIEKILSILQGKYPEPKPFLNFSNDFELLVAVILSAQCTDERVNKTTPQLFPRYNTPEAMLELGVESLEKIIYPCGFYKNKAKNIILMSKKLIEVYNSKVPDKIGDLVSLAGVGRKTASVVLSQAFAIPACPVDTHVFRVVNRLGIVKGNNPLETEKQICKKIDKKHWISFHLQLILHGREICNARKPKCAICPLYALCEWSKKNLYIK